MPQLGLRTRDDLVGPGGLLNVGGAGHQWVVKELHRSDLQHVQDDLGVLWIALVPAVMQGLVRPGQSGGKDGLQVEPGFAKMVCQRAVIITGRLEPDPHRQVAPGKRSGQR